MDDIYQLLYKSMIIIKEMEELTTKRHYDVYGYIKKQDELNSILIDTIKLMIFKKD